MWSCPNRRRCDSERDCDLAADSDETLLGTAFISLQGLGSGDCTIRYVLCMQCNYMYILCVTRTCVAFGSC